MEDITDADYMHTKRVCKDFIQCDTLLLANVFKNFRNISLQIFELYPVCLLIVPGLTWKQP